MKLAWILIALASALLLGCDDKKASAEAEATPEDKRETSAATAEAAPADKRETKCRGGDAQACRELGINLHMGSGDLEKDVARALEIFRLGCEAGDGLSCAGVAIILERDLPGDDGPDAAQISGALQRGCDVGYVRACKMLGVHLLPGGELMKPEPERAVALLDKACHATEPDYEGCMWLASAYQRGEGVAPDVLKSIKLMRRACEEGQLQMACE